MKNPHAVALGRLGGAKGGRARAEALSPGRRRQIARLAGAARAKALSPDERRNLARRAALARWAQEPGILTAADAPMSVQRLLKSYDPADLRWAEADDRYAVVREILVKGDAAAKRWLGRRLKREQVRALVRSYRGAGCNEPERQKLRNKLGLTSEDLPVRPYIGMKWRSPA